MSDAQTAKPIETASFYGEHRSHLLENNNPLPGIEPALPPYLSDPLLGPSKVWKIFKKQQDALNLISTLGLHGELLPFSYESVNFERLFLVANPDVFWFRDCQKKPHLRNTYEIIADGAVSKLYFDLEYDRTVAENKECDGNEMTKTFIRVILYYIRKLFHFKYKLSNVLILDSSTATKFSTHLIFQTPLVFRTNINAGNFVKYVCNELHNINNVCSDEEQLSFDIFKETTINVYAIKDLFVMNAKQARVLFCDLGVYTRNRLFRLYRSTKQGKHAPLVLSSINKFKLSDVSEANPIQYDRFIFLNSLVTYFLSPPDPSMVKEFEKPLVNPNYSSEANLRILEKLHAGAVSPTKESPYPEVDNYIRTRILPHGSIYRNVHFPSTNITVYDIKGFRYCGNIGRWHKSQNIKLIADVNRGVYYQKCHDQDCASYKSPEWPLPPEILFKIRTDEVDDFLGSSGDYLERMMASESVDVATEGRRPESEVAEFIVANSTVNKSEDTSPTFADSTVTDSMISDSTVTESIFAESRVIQSENSSSVVESKGSERGAQTFRRLVREIDKEPNDEIGDPGENRIEGGEFEVNSNLKSEPISDMQSKIEAANQMRELNSNTSSDRKELKPKIEPMDLETSTETRDSHHMETSSQTRDLNSGTGEINSEIRPKIEPIEEEIGSDSLGSDRNLETGCQSESKAEDEGSSKSRRPKKQSSSERQSTNHSPEKTHYESTDGANEEKKRVCIKTSGPVVKKIKL
ncbi:hypothetical protein M8J75_013417 [Diaphorina citri]|nr:hypothetical protein M8J75_013417 [Diaphorina citri]KAI5716013.1 hypothetical protein M8J77_026040 [Diaphorina citri]